MNILFISLADFSSVEENGIYTDLLRCMRDEGHNVYAISPVERRTGKWSHVIDDNGLTIVKPRIGNMQKTGVIEKGLSTLMIGSDLRRAVKREFSDVEFDLVLFPTPPITFVKAVEYVKRRDGATTYLMLKDIFPQNAVDLGMMAQTGLKSLLWRLFREREKRLYDASDFIGCMSSANVEYLLAHNPSISIDKVGLSPNSVIPTDMSCDEQTRIETRMKYGIPLDGKVFVYGGNLGKPQNVSYIVECLRSQMANEETFFLIVGDGTDYIALEEFFRNERPINAKLMHGLPKDEYDALVGSCDVGLIFLDHRFTIPNFPSRLLSYLQAKVPVLCATDPNTDVGRIAEKCGFGISCSSVSVDNFDKAVKRMLDSDLKAMGEAGWDYLLEHYDARDTAREIIATVTFIRNNR